MNVENAKLSLHDLLTMHDACATKFVPIWESIDENERYRKVQNWTDAEKSTIEGQGRQAYSIPLMLAKMLPISEMQRSSRTDFKIEYAVDPARQAKAALATLALKDAVRSSDYQYVESEVFDDAIMVKFGAFEIYVDHAAYYPRVMVRNVDYKNLVWDSNCTDYLLRDKLFIAKIEKVYRRDLTEEYGKAADNAAGGDSSGAFTGRERSSYYVSYADPFGRDVFDIVNKFTHYQRVTRKYYCVIHPDTAGLLQQNDVVVRKYKTRAMAEEKLRAMNTAYLIKDLPTEGEVVVKSETRYDKYVFTYDRMLEYEETELESDPFVVFFPFFVKGDFISVADMLKSPQIFFDRLWMQVDYTLGRNLKNLIEANPQFLAEGMTREQAVRAINDGGIVWTNASMGQNVFREIADTGVNPQYITVAQIMQSLLEDLAGGRSFQGLAEGASESGVSVERKAQLGARTAGPLMDNFKRCKHELGKKLLWWIRNFDTAERIIRVNGGELSQEQMALLQENDLYQPETKDTGYAFVNKQGAELSFLRDADFDLVVTEDEFTEAARSKTLAFNMQAAQVMPQITQTQVWQRKTMLGLGYSLQEVTEILDELQQQQQAAAQAQMAQEQAKQQTELQKTQAQFNIDQQRVNIEKAKVLGTMGGGNNGNGARVE